MQILLHHNSMRGKINSRKRRNWKPNEVTVLCAVGTKCLNLKN